MAPNATMLCSDTCQRSVVNSRSYWLIPTKSERGSIFDEVNATRLTQDFDVSGAKASLDLPLRPIKLKLGYDVPDARTAIEALAMKIGTVLLVLGGMHFLNLAVFSKIRHRHAALPGSIYVGGPIA